MNRAISRANSGEMLSHMMSAVVQVMLYPGVVLNFLFSLNLGGVRMSTSADLRKSLDALDEAIECYPCTRGERDLRVLRLYTRLLNLRMGLSRLQGTLEREANKRSR